MKTLSEFINEKSNKNVVNEGSANSKVVKAYEQLKEILGAEKLLDDVFEALSEDTIKETLEHIIKMHDLDDQVKL